MYDVEAEFLCRSHRLTPEWSQRLSCASTQVSVRLIDEHHFVIQTRIAQLCSESLATELEIARRYLMLCLVSFNIGSLGHFELITRKLGDGDFVVQSKVLPCGGVLRANAAQYGYPSTLDCLDDAAAKRSVRVLTALVKDHERVMVDEYIRGLLHCSHDFFGIDFKKEAFANFYRTFEYIVTRRVLMQTKLKNEVHEICIALERLGVPPSIQEMFRTDIYPIRCSQVMHAWQDQVEVDEEVLGKAKLLCDNSLYEVLKPTWTEAIQNL